ncbi:ABC transporter ATP-binding protein [Marinibaculum pumilum]|uniref:ABC transporter ATP-binding protein n=1 Tax=Marinibaculum pumilum TaxID=1766165 RepID=A0ABV7LA89_9PROT
MNAPSLPAVLRLQGIDKSFDGNPALADAHFTLAAGEVHGLLGENGAGKSTLMTVAAGLYRPDAGRIELHGRPVEIDGPTAARAQGIGMVHQHFKLVRRFTVAENVALACPALKPAGLADAIAACAQGLGFTLRPAALIDSLSIAERQRVEIVKTLLGGARILILDEPTAVLTDEEGALLLAAVRRLADTGTAVVLISHKLREVARHADRVTVMRGGRTVVAGQPTAGLDVDRMAELMVGVSPPADAWRGGHPGRPLLQLNDLALSPGDGGVALQDLQLAIRGGEIYGIAGVGGNGQTELVDLLAGLRRAAAGQIVLDDRRIDGLSTAARRRLGLRVVPADRYGRALAGDLRVFENFAMTALRGGAYGPAAWLRRGRMRDAAAAAIDAHDVRGARPDTRTRLLSGGNAQKLVLARELGPGMRALLAHSPSRGLDVRAAAAVHERLREARDAGAAILVISEDLDEVMALSDRIGVLTRGRIVGEFAAAGDGGERFPRAEIGRLMVGHA